MRRREAVIVAQTRRGVARESCERSSKLVRGVGREIAQSTHRRDDAVYRASRENAAADPGDRERGEESDDELEIDASHETSRGREPHGGHDTRRHVRAGERELRRRGVRRSDARTERFERAYAPDHLAAGIVPRNRFARGCDELERVAIDLEDVRAGPRGPSDLPARARPRRSDVSRLMSVANATCTASENTMRTSANAVRYESVTRVSSGRSVPRAFTPVLHRAGSRYRRRFRSGREDSPPHASCVVD